METERRNISLRLPVALIERLKLMAKRENRSLNNLVECILIKVAFPDRIEADLTSKSGSEK